jgi:POT family proton-dependent oligopeptide transporter
LQGNFQIIFYETQVRMQAPLQSQPAASQTVLGHPKGLFVLFFAEMWERFSYYGMRAILTLYMITSVAGKNPGLGWDEAAALSVYGWYTMLVYVMAIPGGFLADKFIGAKKAVMLGGFILILGHGILAVDTLWAFFLGLGLIVIGVGCLKPNISAMVGALYPPKDPKRDQGFTIFYIGINIGAFLSALIVGFVGEVYGWHYGFALAGIGMAIGQLVFVAGRHLLQDVGDGPSKNTSSSGNAAILTPNPLNSVFSNSRDAGVVLLVAGFSVWLAFRYQSGAEQIAWAALGIFLTTACAWLVGIYRSLSKIEKDRFVLLLLSFLIVIVFWGAYEQAGGLLNIYTLKKINRVVSVSSLDLTVVTASLLLIGKGVFDVFKKRASRFVNLPIGLLLPGLYLWFRETHPGQAYEIPASVFQSLTALFIILGGSAIGAFWIWWQQKGREASSIFKLAVGTIIMGTGFLCMAKASAEIQQYGDKAALWLLVMAYLLHVIGELCASPVALSFITKVAPAQYVSVMMGVYFAATGFGSKLAGFIGENSRTEPIAVVTNAQIPELEKYLVKFDESKAGTNVTVIAEIEKSKDSLILNSKGNSLWSVLSIGKQELQMISQQLEDVPKPMTAILTLHQTEPHAFFTGTLDIFELQEEREFRTFLSISLFSASLGILLLLFLNKLKHLAHGADVPENQQENTPS